jgi:hypothetical protein
MLHLYYSYVDSNIHINQRECMKFMIDVNNQVEWAKQEIYTISSGY